MSSLKVVGVTQTYLFDRSVQVTQLVVFNEDTGDQVPVTVTEEDAYLVLELVGGKLEDDAQDELGEPVFQEFEKGEQI